jgi:5'-methylthioadenosine phosphorylase
MKIVIVETDNSQFPTPNSQQVETPFGVIRYKQLVMNDREVIGIDRLMPQSSIQNPKSKIQNPVDPRAIALAARLLEAERVIGLVRNAGANRPLLPTDFIEFTTGRPTTYFETLGAGYVQQDPPFCPELSQALQSAGAEPAGTLLVRDELPNPAERAWWHERGLSLITSETQPEGTLCRELELCYAVLVVPAEMDLTTLLERMLAYLPVERQCDCGTAVGGKWRQLFTQDQRSFGGTLIL